MQIDSRIPSKKRKMVQSYSNNRPAGIILLFLAALTVLRLAIAGGTGLVFDEAYYRLWGLFPGWGYFDHAPMVAWWVALGQGLAGDTALGTRLLGPLSALVGSLLLWRTAFLLFGRATANQSVLVFNAMLLPSVGSITMTPDVPSVFFWGTTLWALTELRASQDARWWLVIGVLIGLDLLSKYSGVFLGLGILLWLLSDKTERHWFTHPLPYLGALIAIALFSPVIYWNAAHDYVSFAKQLSRTQGENFEPHYIFDLIGAQWLLMTPLIGGIALYSFSENLYTLIPSRTMPTTVLVATSLPFAAYLLLHSLHDRVNANWPAPLMPALAILTAVALEKIQSRFLRPTALASGYAILAIVFIEIIHPFLPIPPASNPAMLTRGWNDLANELETIAKERGLSWIATGSYEHTGGLGFALHDRMKVIQINERIRYGFMPPPDQTLTTKPALFIMWDHAAEGVLKNLAACMGQVDKIGTISRKFDETVIETFSIYKLTDVKITPPIYDRKRDPSACQL
mgnify:CR=1 FL=1